MPKGILGVKKDVKNQMLFFVGRRNDEEWPSDSDDSDYRPVDDDEDEELSRPSKSKRSSSDRQRKSTAKSLKSHSSDDRKEHSSDDRNELKRKHSDSCKSPKRRRIRVMSDSSDDEIDSTVSKTISRSGDTWGQQLPDLVLLKIFKEVVSTDGAIPFLPRMCRVCRLWDQVASNSQLWYNLDLSFGWIKKNERTLNRLFRRQFSHVTDLNLSGWTCLKDNALLQQVIDNFPKLTALNLDGCRVHSTGLMYIADHCNSLRDINLSNIQDGTYIKAIKYIIDKHCDKLISLTLKGSPLRGGTELLKHIMKCSKLESLSLCSMNYSSQPIVLPVEKFQESCPKLKRLELVSCDCGVSSASDVIQAHSAGFPYLEELNLGVSQDISGLSVFTSDAKNNFLQSVLCCHRILKTSKRLKVLDLRNRGSITCNSIPHLSIEGLERLYLSNSSVSKHEGLDLMMNKWKESLVEVDISWNVYEEQSYQRAILQLSSATDSQLRILDVRGGQITSKQIKLLLNGCRRLEMLKLESCRSLPRGMKRNYTKQEIKQLRADVKH